MSNNPVVSVIMIFLNEEKYLQEAIESVLAQTYSDWELLLVDDGSTDKSPEISAQYVAKYPSKIIYLEHEGHQNRGMSATRNLGLQHARGKYIAFLDGDDAYFPHKLEQQVAILNLHSEAAMVYGHTQDWHSWKGNLEDRQLDCIYSLGVETDNVISPPHLFKLVVQRKAPSACTCSVMLRREVLEAVNAFETSFRGLYEDQACFTKVLLQYPVYVSSECWDRYRQHPESCVSLSKVDKKAYYGPNGEHFKRLVFLRWLEQYLIQKNVKDPDIWKVLQRELWPYRHPILSRVWVRLKNILKMAA